jgi:hypothetical protein
MSHHNPNESLHLPASHHIIFDNGKFTTKPTYSNLTKHISQYTVFQTPTYGTMAAELSQKQIGEFQDAFTRFANNAIRTIRS